MTKETRIVAPAEPEFIKRLDAHVEAYEAELHEKGIPVTLSRSALVRIVLAQWMEEREGATP